MSVSDDSAHIREISAHQVLTVPVRRRWLLVPLVAGLVLCAVSFGWQRAKAGGWQPLSEQLDSILNVDNDLSVLNWLTTSLFLLAAVGALVLAVTWRRRWWFVAAFLGFVSLDEAVGLHDPLQKAVERQLDAGGVRAVGVALLALLAGVLVIRFLLSLPRPAAWRLAAVALLIALAAVGVDALGPDLTDDPGRRLEDWYIVKATLEETCELCASVVALDAVFVAALFSRAIPRPVGKGGNQPR